MSIRIEVTGTSIGEVADKLLAIGSSLRNTAVNNADNAAREALQAERKAKAPRKKAEPEVAEEAPVDPTLAAEATQASSAPDSTPENVSPTSDSGPTATETASPTDELDFEKDVAPVVIEAVSRVGREGVSSTLAEFGVERASEVDPSQYAELVKALEAL